jgi:hypothetical protein
LPFEPVACGCGDRNFNYTTATAICQDFFAKKNKKIIFPKTIDKPPTSWYNNYRKKKGELKNDNFYIDYFDFVRGCVGYSICLVYRKRLPWLDALVWFSDFGFCLPRSTVDGVRENPPPPSQKLFSKMKNFSLTFPKIYVIIIIES